MTQDYGLQNEMKNIIDHGIRVSQLSYQVAKELELKENWCYEISVASVLHDIGKLKLNRYIYQKNDTLSTEEYRYVRMHEKYSYEILETKGYSQFILDSVLYHHENFDGTGYPFFLKGEEIPIGARIIKVCDIYTALTDDRPYRKAFDKETAMKIMIDEVKKYDLKIFLTFQRIIHNMYDVKKYNIK